MQGTLFFAAGRMFAATSTGQVPVTLVALLLAGSVRRAWRWEAELLSFRKGAEARRVGEERGFRVVEKPAWLA